jgi:hypothetical protein
MKPEGVAGDPDGSLQFDRAYLKERMAELAHDAPDVVRAVYPRRVVSPQDYANHLLLGVMSATCVSLFLKEPPNSDSIESLHSLGAIVAGKYNLPTYYVSADLAQALMATHPPDEMTYAQVPWSVPAAVFMLPDCVGDVLTGTKPMILQIAYVRSDETFMGREVINSNAIVVSAICRQGEEMTLGAHLLNPKTTLSTAAATEIRDFEARETAKRDPTMQTMAQLGVVLLMALAARPELVEAGLQTRKTPPKPRDPLDAAALWSPTWLGRHYHLTRHASLGGSHASPRAHMRGGHFHTYLIGPGRQKRAFRWLEPMWVNLDISPSTDPAKTP